MGSSVIPALRYHDAPKAIEWLSQAFGFVPHLVVEEEDGGGRIAHAQLTSGTGMIMLGSVAENEYDDLVTAVGEGAKSTVGIYIVVEDVDAHAERAANAGAEIVQEPEDQHYGGRLYTCRDFAGNVWSFGSYDPWADQDH